MFGASWNTKRPESVCGPALTVDLSRDGAEPRQPKDAREVYLYSDLKRHDLGAALTEPRADRGVEASSFITAPLWGVARSRPYLHDGRAPTLEDAILLHGGEAAKARDGYIGLAEADRATVRVFLTSLTRARRVVVP